MLKISNKIITSVFIVKYSIASPPNFIRGYVPSKIKRANRLPKVGLPYSVFNYTIFRHCPQGEILCFRTVVGVDPYKLTV